MKLSKQEKAELAHEVLSKANCVVESAEDGVLLLRSEKYPEQSFWLAATFRTRGKDESFSFHVGNDSVERIEKRLTAGNDEIAFGYFVEDGNTLYALVIPRKLFEQRLNNEDAFSYNPETGYRVNFSYFDKFERDPSVIAALSVARHD